MLVAKLKSLSAGLLVLIVVASGGAVLSPERSEAASEANAQQGAVPPRLDRQGNVLPPGAVARLGSVRFRYEGLLGPFALSPDGRTVAAVLLWRGNSVAFWDAATGKLTRRMTFDQPVHYLTFAPDGKSLALGLAGDLQHPNGSLRIIDLDSGAEKRRFEGFKNSGFLKLTEFGTWGAAFFTPDGRTLINLRKDGTVQMWDVQSGKETGKLAGGEWNLWDLSPDGKLLAAAQERSKNVLHLMDAVTGKEVRQLKHSSNASTAAFSPDGKILAVAAGRPTGKERRENPEPVRIALWSVETGKALGVLPGSSSVVTALAFSPDGKTLVSGEQSSALRLWDVASQKEIKKAEFEFYSISQLAFEHDGKTLIIRGNENHLRLWDVAAWRERFAEEGPAQEITSVVFSPDGKLVACASPNHYYAFGNRVWVWKSDTGELVRKLDTAEWPMMFSADSNALMVAGRGFDSNIWDLKTGKSKPGPSIRGIVRGTTAVSPDGKTIASWDRNPGIDLAAIGEGKIPRFVQLPADPPRPQAYVTSLCFSLNGKTLFAGGVWKQILRWDVATGKALPHLGEHDSSLSMIALSADGRSLAAMTSAGSLYLWEPASGQARLRIKDAGPANRMAFSPDGRFLALTNRVDGTSALHESLFPRPPANLEQIRLIRLADGKAIRGFSGHLGGIDCVSFSPDGRRLASGGHDGTVLLWDVSALQGKKGSVLEPAQLDALWASLNGTAEEAHRAIVTLTAAPTQTVPFLRAKLKPISKDAALIARLVKQLDSDQFREREAALEELKKRGEAVEPYLYKALKNKPSLEMRRRLQQLLNELRGEKNITGERLRFLRALEVLERIGDKPAREALQRLAEGEAGARLLEEAKTALQRLQRRSE